MSFEINTSMKYAFIMSSIKEPIYICGDFLWTKIYPRLHFNKLSFSCPFMSASSIPRAKSFNMIPL